MEGPAPGPILSEFNTEVELFPLLLLLLLSEEERWLWPLPGSVSSLPFVLLLGLPTFPAVGALLVLFCPFGLSDTLSMQASNQAPMLMSLQSTNSFILNTPIPASMSKGRVEVDGWLSCFSNAAGGPEEDSSPLLLGSLVILVFLLVVVLMLVVVLVSSVVVVLLLTVVGLGLVKGMLPNALVP